MEQRIYKKPPINEMYMSAHFQAQPPIGTLDFHVFAEKIRSDWEKEDYVFPIIESAGDFNKIIAEPEKIWFQSKDGARLLQFIRDRMVYNWRMRSEPNQPVIYPKYEGIKKDFFKYWLFLLNYINSYKDRKLTVKMFELYYHNVLPIGPGHFLKDKNDIYKAIKFISPFDESYKNVKPQINLQIPFKDDNLFLSLDKIKDKRGQDAFSLAFVMRSASNQNLENIKDGWYDSAHKEIRAFFEEIMTEDIKNYWKKESGL